MHELVLSDVNTSLGCLLSSFGMFTETKGWNFQKNNLRLSPDNFRSKNRKNVFVHFSGTIQ